MCSMVELHLQLLPSYDSCQVGSFKTSPFSGLWTAPLSRRNHIIRRVRISRLWVSLPGLISRESWGRHIPLLAYIKPELFERKLLKGPGIIMSEMLFFPQAPIQPPTFIVNMHTNSHTHTHTHIIHSKPGSLNHHTCLQTKHTHTQSELKSSE